MDEIECAVRLVLEDLGGEAQCSDVVRAVGALLQNDWTEADLEWMTYGRRWEARVRSSGPKLGKDGVLAWSGAPRGIWRLK